MNLTEVLLSIIISMAVLASGFFLYASVSERSAANNTMQSLSLLRANIEDVYQGDYSSLEEDSAAGGTLYGLGMFPQALTKGQGLATRWGDLTLAGSDDGSEYTITLSQLSPEACLALGRYQYRSWAKVDIDGTTLWERGQTDPFSMSDLASVCQGERSTLTFTAP